MTDAEVLEQLQCGYRMPQPDECPTALYHVMCDCWQETPRNRPSFKELQWELGKFLITSGSDTVTSDPQHAIFADPAEVLGRHNRKY